MHTGFWWGNVKESLLGRLGVGEYNSKVYLKLVGRVRTRFVVFVVAPCIS